MILFQKRIGWKRLGLLALSLWQEESWKFSFPNVFPMPALCLDLGCVPPAGWEILQLVCSSINREVSNFCIVTHEDRTL